MRKHWLDNLRWGTVLSVLLFHCVMMYNGVGVFGGLEPFSDGVQYQDIILYILYPFFMPLLFVVAGISSRYYLENHNTHEFISSRTLKLLVPSTIGLFVFQWITGYLNTRIAEVAQRTEIISNIPGPARYFAYVMSGTGPLWFIQVLWLLSLILALIRRTDKGDRLYVACGKHWPILTAVFGILMYLTSQTLVKDLSTNPFGGLINLYKPQFYIVPFLLGYLVLSHDKAVEKLKSAALPLAGIALVLGITLICTTFGQDPTSPQYLGSILANAYAYFMILGLVALSAKYLDRTSRFADYMTKSSFGIYVVHYTIVAGLGFVLKMHTSLPAAAVYALLIVGTFILSPALYELLSRIPVLRWCVFGIKKQKDGNRISQ